MFLRPPAVVREVRPFRKVRKVSAEVLSVDTSWWSTPRLVTAQMRLRACGSSFSGRAAGSPFFEYAYLARYLLPKPV